MVERAQVFVIDASVAAKWFIEEEERGEAVKLRQDYVSGEIDLASPMLMPYEVFNVLRYHAGFSSSDVSRYMKSLMDMQIDLRAPTDEITALAAKLAFSERISGYDAHYIALAQTINTQLITSDVKLANRLSQTTRSTLMLLQQYPKDGDSKDAAISG